MKFNGEPSDHTKPDVPYLYRPIHHLLNFLPAFDLKQTNTYERLNGFEFIGNLFFLICWFIYNCSRVFEFFSRVNRQQVTANIATEIARFVPIYPFLANASAYVVAFALVQRPIVVGIIRTLHNLIFINFL